MSFTCFNTWGNNEPLTAIYKKTNTTGSSCPKIIDPRCLACALILLNNVALAAEKVSKENNDDNNNNNDSVSICCLPVCGIILCLSLFSVK